MSGNKVLSPHRWAAVALAALGMGLAFAWNDPGGSGAGVGWVAAGAYRPSAAETRFPRPTEKGYVAGADGVRLYYERYGTRTPTVFIADRPSVHLAFAPLLARYDVVTWDPRGSGRSSRPEDPGLYSAHHHLADAEAIMVHFGAERLTFVGASHWGSLGVLYAARYPERVARLILVEPLPLLEDWRMDGTRLACDILLILGGREDEQDESAHVWVAALASARTVEITWTTHLSWKAHPAEVVFRVAAFLGE